MRPRWLKGLWRWLTAPPVDAAPGAARSKLKATMTVRVRRAGETTWRDIPVTKPKE